MKSKLNQTITLEDGRTLGFAEYGDPKGRPVFYLHGWPSSRLLGKETDSCAKGLNIRIVAMDRPGFGLSTFQINRRMLDFPKDVLALADYLKIKKFAVMGVSGGGPYAATCAFSIPQRLTKTGIVVGLGPIKSKEALEGMGVMNKLGWGNYARIPGLKSLSSILSFISFKYFPFVRYFSFPAKVDKKMLTNGFQKALRENIAESFRQGWRGPAWDLKVLSDKWEFNLSKIKGKVYLFYGDADKNVSIKMGEYLASKIPGSKLTVYPGEGHFCRMSHEEDILKALS